MTTATRVTRGHIRRPAHCTPLLGGGGDGFVDRGEDDTGRVSIALSAQRLGLSHALKARWRRGCRTDGFELLLTILTIYGNPTGLGS